jgi:hypothetical protein
MKTFILLLAIISISFGQQSSRVAAIATLVADLDVVEGSAVYDGGDPGRFYLLARYVLRWSSDDEIEALLADSRPIVRLLGYQTALLRGLEVSAEKTDSVITDTTPMDFFPYGCDGTHSTVGEIAKQLKSKPTLIIEYSE